ncbi:MAG TPA: enoyl-CoA hydratase/isomerase family protein [Roseomonas sp.]|nr:enoyl-CoA hydratase/isomerase family protein [Roseomonas sp.]
MSGTLRVERGEDGVTTLWIDNPSHRNALNDGIIAALIAALEAAGEDAGCRVVMLRGTEGIFCAGRELNDVRALQAAGTEAAEAAYRTLLRLNEALYYCRRPTVAVLERYALGAGAALASWADLALAEAGCKIGYPEVLVGLPPSQTTVSLIRNVPRKVAMDLLLTARNVEAEEAQRMGLVSRVVPAVALEEAVAAITAQLLRASPDAIARTKRMIWKVEDSDYRAAMTGAADTITVAVTGREAREGIAAFVEKRKPAW